MGSRISDAADVERQVLAEIRSLKLERSAAAPQRADQLQLSPAPSSAGSAASRKSGVLCPTSAKAASLAPGAPYPPPAGAPRKLGTLPLHRTSPGSVHDSHAIFSPRDGLQQPLTPDQHPGQPPRLSRELATDPGSVGAGQQQRGPARSRGGSAAAVDASPAQSLASQFDRVFTPPWAGADASQQALHSISTAAAAAMITAPGRAPTPGGGGGNTPAAHLTTALHHYDIALQHFAAAMGAQALCGGRAAGLGASAATKRSYYFRTLLQLQAELHALA